MVSSRSWAGPTGQPGLHVADTCGGVDGGHRTHESTRRRAGAAAGVAAAVVGGAGAAGARRARRGGAAVAVDEGPGTAVTWEWVWRSGDPGCTGASRPAVRSERRPVATATVRWRPGRGTDAHHSRGRPVPGMVGVAVLVVLLGLLRSCGAPVGDRHRVAARPVPSTTRPPPSTVPPTVATTVPTTVAPTVPAPAPVKHTTPAPATTAPRPVPPAPPRAAPRHPPGGRGLGHPGDRGERVGLRADDGHVHRLPRRRDGLAPGVRPVGGPTSDTPASPRRDRSAKATGARRRGRSGSTSSSACSAIPACSSRSGP